jgi:hypothetical protein
MDLLSFLIEAKKNTYASLRVTDKVNKDGAKELIYENYPYKYKDRYYGYNPFIGQEVVFENDNFVWGMNYYGSISTIEIKEIEVYSFLKSSLVQVEKRFPFRGPNYFKKQDFEYFSDTKGSIEGFIGEEYIDYKGGTIYKCFYHGGTIRRKLI